MLTCSYSTCHTSSKNHQFSVSTVFVLSSILGECWSIVLKGSYCSSCFCLAASFSVAAIYDSTHPDLLQYVYLFGPISLLCLNPFGFLSLEIERNQNQPDVSKLRMVLGVLKGVITNPIMVSVLLGVAFNIITHQSVPGILKPVVNVVADSFSATALFYLGICLSGQLQKMSGKALLPVILLISAKL